MMKLSVSIHMAGTIVAFLESLTDPITVLPPIMHSSAKESKQEMAATLSGQFRFLASPPEVGLVYFSDDQGLRQAVAIDQQGKEFLHLNQHGEKSLRKIVVGSPGETMTFTNSASIAHNIYASDKRLGVQFDLGLAPPSSGFTKTYPLSWAVGGVLRIGCKIHPGMQLYIASLASRYYKELEFNGAQVLRFDFETLPAQLTQVAVWLPEYDLIEVSINLGEQKEVPIKKQGQLQGILTLKRQ